MHIEAIFSNIANRILNEIESAEQSVYIAVAWFTNKLIFDKLLIKAKNGCKVYIIISNDKINEKNNHRICRGFFGDWRGASKRLFGGRSR